MLLSKYELEQVISEYDAMSMAYLRNPVQNVELMECVKCGGTSTSTTRSVFSSWVIIALVTDTKTQQGWIEALRRLEAGRLIFGTTSFQSFQDLRRQLQNDESSSRVDILLFRHNQKVLPSLQLCTLVQELQDIDTLEYVMTVDENVRLDCLDPEKMVDTIRHSGDGIVLPHHLICLSENGIKTKSNEHHYEYEDKVYYVSTFDTGFNMDSHSTLYYRIMSPVKFVQMNHVLACSMETFKSLEMFEYTFDVEGSMFYVALDTGRCVFMTSPMSFAATDTSPLACSASTLSKSSKIRR